MLSVEAATKHLILLLPVVMCFMLAIRHVLQYQNDGLGGNRQEPGHEGHELGAPTAKQLPAALFCWSDVGEPCIISPVSLSMTGWYHSPTNL